MAKKSGGRLSNGSGGRTCRHNRAQSVEAFDGLPRPVRDFLNYEAPSKWCCRCITNHIKRTGWAAWLKWSRRHLTGLAA